MNQIINDFLVSLNKGGSIFCSHAAGTFIQSALLVMVLFVIDLLLHKWVRSIFRYCLWLLVLIKLVLPPTLSLPTGIGYWTGDKLSSAFAVSHRSQDEIYFGEMPSHVFSAHGPSNEVSDVKRARTRAETELMMASDMPISIRITWQTVLFLLWFLGVFIFVVLLVRRARYVRTLIAASSPADEEMHRLLGQCRQQIGWHRHIGLRVSDAIPSPAVCGFLKPTVLIPTGLIERLSPKGLRSALVHELAHIKRGDLWVNGVQTLVQIIYFYNPFVWFANAMIRRVCEEAVDETVLVALGGEAEDYSDTLIDINETVFWRTALSLRLRLIGVAESRKALQWRIRHMLNRPIPKSSKVGIFGTILIIVIAAVLLPMAKAEKPKRANMNIAGDTPTSGSIVERSSVVELAPKPTPGMILRRIKTKVYAQDWAAISPDGKYLCDSNWKGELVVRELTTGEQRVIVQRGRSGDFASQFAISPDSKKVAYRWYDSEKKNYELHVIGLDGSGRRTIRANDIINPEDWSPDGKQILGIRPRPEDVENKTYPFVTQIVSVSSEDGSMKLVRTSGKNSPNWLRSSVDLSPNGRYVAYEVSQDEGFQKSDIFLLDLDDKREIPLVKHSADDKLLGWTPDGRYIFFASDRRGTWDGWILQVVDKNERAMPRLAKASIGNIYPLGFTENGACYYAQRFFTGGVYTASVDLKSGKVLSGPDAVQHGLYGCPAWSPDGHYLAYCVLRPDGLSSIHIRSLVNGQEHLLDTDLQKVRWLIWSPDGRSLLIAEPTGGSPGMSAVYQIDAQTGKSNLLLQIEAGTIRRPEFFPDGKSLLYGVQRAGRYLLLTRDLETGQEKKIFEFSRQRSSYFPCWNLSPDGKQVLISGAGPNSPSQLKIISIEGEETRELLPEKWDEVHYVAWAPDGQSVLFSLQKDYLHAELWQISAEGGQPRKISTTLELGFWQSLCLHPDGRRIAFHAYEGGNELWVIENFMPSGEVASR